MQNLYTPLHAAASGGHIAAMKVLLDANVGKEAQSDVSYGGAKGRAFQGQNQSLLLQNQSCRAPGVVDDHKAQLLHQDALK